MRLNAIAVESVTNQGAKDELSGRIVLGRVLKLLAY
jgi:hypothetical protein